MWYLRDGDDLLLLDLRQEPEGRERAARPAADGARRDGREVRGAQGRLDHGLATVVDDLDEVLAFGEQVYEKYWGPIDNDLVREGVRTMGAKRVVIRVDAR